MIKLIETNGKQLWNSDGTEKYSGNLKELLDYLGIKYSLERK